MQPQDVPHAPRDDAAPAVLDTNVVLALYWFQDARLGRLAQALQTGQLRWLATSEMRQELVHVLARWQGDSAARGPSSGLPEEGPGIQDACSIAWPNRSRHHLPAPHQGARTALIRSSSTLR